MKVLRAGIVLSFFLVTQARAEPMLSLNDYLSQIRKQNQSYLGSERQKEGAKERISEKDVVLSPTLFSNAQWESDAKLPQLPIYSFNSLDTQTYNLGVSQTTTFGLQAKLYYELDYTNFVGLNLSELLPPGTSIPLAFYDARPVVELTQSLWQNGFGNSTRANQLLLESQALSDHYGAEAQMKSTLLNAELAYRRLAVGRESVRIGKAAFDQAEGIFKFVSGREKMNLGEVGDVLQAKASLESQRLQLMFAREEEVSASINFNAFRNLISDEVTEQLPPLDWERLEALAIPTSHGTRADVKQAQAQAKLTAANSQLQAEKDKPVLDVYGSYALNGRDVTVSDALGNSYQAARPTVMAGLRFSMPLDFGATSDAKHGAAAEEIAADMMYHQKVLDQDSSWRDLTRRLSSARERLALARTIVSAQKQKLDYERTRLRQGRTTTYQILLFEQDYLQAQLTQTQVASDVLNTIAQLKLYEDGKIIVTLSELSIRRPIFITCIVILMVAAGVVSFRTSPVDLYPDLTFPVVTVTTLYPGTGPTEMETLITKPLEDELTTIAGVKRLTSKSLEGTSQVITEFYLGTDIKFAEQQVRDRVSTAKAKMPKDIKEPVIRQLDPSDQPVFTIAVRGDLPDAALYDVADNFIKPRLTQVKDVGLVNIVGGRKREIQVTLDRQKLKGRSMSVNSVANQIGLSGENIPVGQVNRQDNETVFRAVGEYHSTTDIENTLVSLYGNEIPTKVSDVGFVKDTVEDERSRVFVNGTKSLFIDIYRQSGSNTLAVVEAIKKKVEGIKLELNRRPEKVDLAFIRDASVPIRLNVEDVKNTILIGIILTVVVVFLFLGNGRSTIITGLALPNSLLGAFILMALAGFTVNIITLLSMSLAIGLLIDDAIVVRENIFRHIENGSEPRIAALEGTKEVTLAVIATTLVIIAVFGPVAFMKGIIGQFLRQFGLTICFAMAISLFDALTIAPMLSAYFAGNLHKKRTGIWQATVGQVLRLFNKMQDGLEVTYEKTLNWILRHPIKTLGGSFLVFVISMASVTKIPKTFVPPQDNGEFAVSLDLPPGTNLDAMNRTATKVDEIIRGNKEVTLSALTVGGSNGEANVADFYVRLVPSKERTLNTTGVKDKVREQLVQMASANPKVIDYDPSGSGQARQFTLNLVGAEPQTLQEYANSLFQKLKSDKRLKEVDTSYRPGKPELQVLLQTGKAEIYGINTSTMGSELRAQVEGVTPAKFRENGNEYDVRVRLDESQRDLKANFDSAFVPNVNGKLVRLSDIAEPKTTEAAATIDRQDRGRFVQLSADIATGAGLGDVMKDVDQLMKSELKLPANVRAVYVGNSENFSEFSDSVVIAMGFACLLVFLVLSSLYESFITPFTIMVALPLALCGAFVALFLTQQSLNILAFLGISMLLGVACKNSILLVDYTSHLMRDGMERIPALVLAGKTRLRPILMTSMALIAGTLPVALGLSEASKQRTSMGIAIIGGVISSTLLTLIVVPAAFIYIDRFRNWFEGLFRRISGSTQKSGESDK